MNQKTIVIFLTIIIVIAILFGGYFLFFRTTPQSVTGPSGGSGGGGTFPSGGGTEIPGGPGRPIDAGGDAGTGGGTGAGGVGSGQAGADKPQQVLMLVQLTQNSISGAGLSCQQCAIGVDGRPYDKAASTTVRYIEKSTGHIYEIGFGGENKKRISNNTVLRTHDSYWSLKGDKFALRFFEEEKAYPKLKTYLGIFPQPEKPSAKKKTTAMSTSTVATQETAATSTPVKGIFLPLTVKDIAVSPYEDKVFYLDTSGEIALGIVSDFENKNQKTVFSLSFKEFNVSWQAKNHIGLLTKPSALAEGFLYLLDVKTGKMEKMLGNIDGLTALVSPDAEKIIYSQTPRRSSGFETKIFTRKDKSIAAFSMNVLPEKCVWSRNEKNIVYCAFSTMPPAAQYPDEWYQGLVSFNDAIWRVDTATGKTEILTDAKNTDVINPFLSFNEDYLFFTNKKDNTLWSLRLK